LISTTARSRRSPLRLTTGLLALVTGGVLILGGCGSGDSVGTTDPAPAGSASAQNPSGGNGAAAGGNFVTGLIADVSGKTLQVQGTDSQTAVTYTSKTTFSEQVKISASAVKAGSCVMVQSADAAGDSTAVTATSVSVSSPVDGECTGGGGFGASGRPSGMPSGAPSDRPSGDPPGGQSGRPGGAGGRGVVGQVQSVSGSGFTVATTAMGDAKSQTYTVTTTTKTTFTEQQKATASAVKVGKCATAAGKIDSTGAVSATSIALSQATNGTCSMGMGRPSGGRSNG
jgi:hypothetical protein